MAAFTGLRLGELRALRWRQVSFERGTLTVAAAMSAGQVESPKWGKARTVPLATPAAAELARLADRGRFVEHDDLVFCGPLGDTLDDSAIRRRLRRAQKAAGLRPLRFHDLRHSFGSLVVRELDTATLKGWLGHTSLATTERYLHAKPRHSDVARLDRAFSGRAAELERTSEVSESVTGGWRPKSSAADFEAMTGAYADMNPAAAIGAKKGADQAREKLLVLLQATGRMPRACRARRHLQRAVAAGRRRFAATTLFGGEELLRDADGLYPPSRPNRRQLAWTLRSARSLKPQRPDVIVRP